jgi:hypothetical protein
MHKLGSVQIFMAYYISAVKNKRSGNTFLANAPSPLTCKMTLSFERFPGFPICSYGKSNM